MSQFLEVGIDLGTTNSAIACIQGAETKVLPNNDQMNVTPSAVRILKTGSIIVGRRAANAIVNDAENVATEFKRLIGQNYQKHFPASNLSLSPEELSAEVLKSMLADARRLTEKEVKGAVITVPAAFTALQCEATARAAQMAGLTEYPLLQEPIAAALAYGANSEKKGKLWLVFDLGGGTLDVAVISADGSNLRVLEHCGDNHLGGKDIDHLLVGEILLPHLRENYELPETDQNSQEFAILYKKLSTVAEFAKIQLSTAESVNLSIFDVGEDLSGNPIESELVLERSRLEKISEPIYQRSLALVHHSIKQARIKSSDIDRILLVGGPTQADGLRRILRQNLGLEVDSSLDPMTVVAQGATLYASTYESKIAETSSSTPVNLNEISVKLAYDPVTNSSETLIAGKVAGVRAKEVSLESADGIWLSGWIKLDEDSLFEINVPLKKNLANVFNLRLRDESGREYPANPKEIVIRQGIMTISAPPLPHTISVEVVGAEKQSVLTPIFERMTLLPIEKDFNFRAAGTLRPSEPETALVIKLWEGETFNDPSANHWIGNMKIKSESIRRPIPEGSEIQLHLKIDTSRLITVEAFIPHLNQHFSDKIYFAQEGQLNYLKQFERLPEELDNCLFRLIDLENYLIYHASEITRTDSEFPEMIFNYADSDGQDFVLENYNQSSPQEEINKLRRLIEDVQIEVFETKPMAQTNDDLARGLVDRVRMIRAKIAELEKKFKYSKAAENLNEILRQAQEIELTINEHGTEIQRDKYRLLYDELKKSISRSDKSIAQRQLKALKDLRFQVLEAQDWFWENWLSHYNIYGIAAHSDDFQKWLDEGNEGQNNSDILRLKTAVRNLWRLDRSTEEANPLDSDDSKLIRPGLKK